MGYANILMKINNLCKTFAALLITIAMIFRVTRPPSIEKEENGEEIPIDDDRITRKIIVIKYLEMNRLEKNRKSMPTTDGLKQVLSVFPIRVH